MKIRLVNQAIHSVLRAEVVNGRLEVDFNDKSAEEVQDVFSVPGNLQTIELLTDEGDVFGDLPGWTVYGGTVLVGDKKTAILTKAINVTEERLTAAESAAIQADAKAAQVEARLVTVGEELTQTQMALCDVYETIAVTGGVA